MRLTRRGYAVVAVTGLAVGLAATFGTRALDVVAVGGVVSLLAGYLQIRGLAAPGVTREVPPDGFPGEGGAVRLAFAVDEPYAAEVRDRLPAGVHGDGRVETTVGDGVVDYEVTYRGRGEHTFERVTVRARDVLGLVEQSFEPVARERVLVYPRVHELTLGARSELLSVHEPERNAERDEFDRLREYDRGDALRDIHWKTSAKRDDLVVKVFAAEADANAVTVAAGAAPGHGDAMAEAAASVCLPFVEAGIPVQLSTPGGEVTVAGGDRERLLEHLARVPDGDPAAGDVDVVVEAGETTRVVIRGADRRFEELVGEPAPAAESATAGSRPGPGSAAATGGLAWDRGVEG
jgi:uncharacterized protein (DUF58 family)